MRSHQLFAKRIKCCFSSKKVEYLGHVIHDGTVAMNKDKVQCVSQLPMPKSAKELRSFLRLSRFYRWFIRQYSLLAKPLTDHLEKNRWGWFFYAT